MAYDRLTVSTKMRTKSGKIQFPHKQIDLKNKVLKQNLTGMMSRTVYFTNQK